MPNNDWDCMLEGDKNAFLKIYHENYHSLFRYGYSLTCDKELTKDSIQELFLEIWNKRSTIKKEVEHVRSYLSTWLRRKISRTISRNEREKYGDVLVNNSNPIELSYEELLIAFQETEEKKEKINRALNKLTKKQIEIIRLKYFENLSYPAIADKTSLTTRTIYNIIYEAIQQLRGDETLVVHQ